MRKIRRFCSHRSCPRGVTWSSLWQNNIKERNMAMSFFLWIFGLLCLFMRVSGGTFSFFVYGWCYIILKPRLVSPRWWAPNPQKSWRLSTKLFSRWQHYCWLLLPLPSPLLWMYSSRCSCPSCFVSSSMSFQIHLWQQSFHTELWYYTRSQSPSRS